MVHRNYSNLRIKQRLTRRALELKPQLPSVTGTNELAESTNNNHQTIALRQGKQQNQNAVDKHSDG